MDSLVDLSRFSCDWAFLLFSCSFFQSYHLLCFYSKFNGRFAVLFGTNNTLTAFTLPSVFGENSMIFPIFHHPRGMFAFIWALSPLDGISFALTRGDFIFICDLSRRLNR